MTTPQTRLSPLEVRERAACMCNHGDVCSSYARGHALHLIQARLASATPSAWADGIVVGTAPAEGRLTVQTLDGNVLELWNAGSAALEAPEGTPVAVHTQYDVLAVGSVRYNVARV